MGDALFVPRRIDSLLRERTLMNRKEVTQCLNDGRVSAFNQLIVDPRQLIFDENSIIVDGEKLPPATPTKVFAFHKPSGLISAYKSAMGKPNIGPFMDKMGENLMHVGRLDKLTTGLLLITNDGDLCHGMTDPSCNTEKKYLLEIDGSIESIGTKIEKLSHPIVNRNTKIEVSYHAKNIKVVSSNDGKTQVEVTLTEGKNRQIRRMCAILHLELLHLHRTCVGSVSVGDLKPGDFRALNDDEMADLYAPFGGVDGFERRRAEQLIALFDLGGFLPDLANDVKKWKESYLG